jgi:hypothetical protein
MNQQLDAAVKLVPLIAVFISILGFLAALRKDRKLRLKEYADRVRKSAALVVARADRWKHLSLSLFQDIQVAITDTDIILVKEGDVRKADDFLWRELFIAQRAIARKITDEQIEIAYADLFGYDTSIHDLFGNLVQRLAKADRKMFVALLKRTQNDIVSSYREDRAYVSTVLGNRLRTTAKEISLQCARLLEAALAEFRSEMIKIVASTDEEIARKKIVIRPPSEVFSEFDKISDIMSENERTTTTSGGANLKIEGQNQESQRSEPVISGNFQDLSAPPPENLKTERKKPAIKAEKGPRSVNKSTQRNQNPEAPIKRNSSVHVQEPLTGVGDRDPEATMPDPIIPPGLPPDLSPPVRGGYDDEDR